MRILASLWILGLAVAAFLGLDLWASHFEAKGSRSSWGWIASRPGRHTPKRPEILSLLRG